MKTKSIVVLFCTLSLLINACSMPGGYSVIAPTAQPNPAVRFDMYVPPSGSIHQVGEVLDLRQYIQVVPYGSSTTIRDGTFLINGVPVETTNGEYYPLAGTWTASGPGEYYIQAKVTLSDGSIAITYPSRICVMSLINTLPSSWEGYLGPCPLATPVDNPASTGVVAINAVAAPSIIKFSSACPSNTSVTFVAYVDDPQDRVALVGVSVSSSDAPGSFGGQYLNWITTRPGNNKEYRGTMPFSSSFLAVTHIVDWRVSAWDRTGLEIQATRDVITVQPAECTQPRPGISPPTLTPTPEVPDTATPTQAVQPTFTLTKNSFCRRGPNMSFSTLTSFTAGETGDILNISEDGVWYFVDWKKADVKCWVAIRTGDASGDLTRLKVLIVPTLDVPELSTKPTLPPESEPALPPASGCSSYGDASSCTTNGCSWDKATSSCN